MSKLDSTSTIGHRITLRNGRHLGYAEYGDPAGVPVLLFRGTPSSRLAYRPDDTFEDDLTTETRRTRRPEWP